MQITDFGSLSPKINQPSRKKLVLEYLTATLVFVFPALVLFVLAK
jgi:hypothetical protein